MPLLHDPDIRAGMVDDAAGIAHRPQEQADLQRDQPDGEDDPHQGHAQLDFVLKQVASRNRRHPRHSRGREGGPPSSTLPVLSRWAMILASCERFNTIRRTYRTVPAPRLPACLGGTTMVRYSTKEIE